MAHLKKSRKIVQILHDAGFIAYYAGGWVRDFLLGVESEEVDIATSASPEEIAALFPKTLAVGKAFGVMVVCFEGEQFEVATFRKDHPYSDGRHPQGIDLSDPVQDAQRRDFTINGLFFDPLQEIVYDYVEGEKDLANKIIRAIGNPKLRFEEDRLRMIRAVRFATTLGFTLEKETAKEIVAQAKTLFPSVSKERILQEFTKMAKGGHMGEALLLLYDLGLLQMIFPKESWTKSTLEEKVRPFSHFPRGISPLIYLREILPSYSPKELSCYLKSSKKEEALLTYLGQKPENKVEWVYFYADLHFPLWLQIEAAKLPEAKRESFLEEQEKRRNKLEPHIKRVQHKTPLVTAAILQRKGILAGVEMGKILERAERIAIEENIEDVEEILKRVENEYPR